MNRKSFSKQFRVAPSTNVRLKHLDPKFTGHHGKKQSLERTKELSERMNDLQLRLYAESKRSVLICLQALDAGGKDGVVKHVIGALNPAGCLVASFKEPTKEELTHDFLWRVEAKTPKRGEMAIFNRSHYEDVLIVRVHDLVPKKTWSKRYDQINDFERRLSANGTHVLKFFLHISKEEQLKRFEERLDNPSKQWKISESDYSEREYWDDYEKAYEAVFDKCNTSAAPWFVIPADHKWFRDLAMSEIIVEALQDLNIQVPKPTVNIEDIRRRYHSSIKKEKRTN
jgi:PPK2 family polyphosphate:nucleotide phosphotransferase